MNSLIEPTEAEWKAIVDAYPLWEYVEAAIIVYGRRVAADTEKRLYVGNLGRHQAETEEQGSEE